MRKRHLLVRLLALCLPALPGFSLPAVGQNANQWTWMGGSNTVGSNCPNSFCGRPGVYGTLGTPTAANVPGSRSDAVGWSDANGNLWLFGGTGVDAAGEVNRLNDVWKFQIVSPPKP